MPVNCPTSPRSLRIGRFITIYRRVAAVSLAAALLIALTTLTSTATIPGAKAFDQLNELFGLAPDASSLVPTFNVNPSLIDFSTTSDGETVISETSAPKSSTLTGSELTADITCTLINSPDPSFQISATGTEFSWGTAPLVYSPVSGSLNATLYARFIPLHIGDNIAKVTCAGPGGLSRDINLTGKGSSKLNVDVEGEGLVTSNDDGIECPNNCNETYKDVVDVVLTADPAAGYSFAGWSGACTGIGTCTVNTEENREVTATFADLTPPSLTYTPLSSTATPGNRPLAVTAIDAGTVASVTSTAAINGGSAVISPCTHGSGDIWNCTLPGNADSYVTYYVTATDEAGNSISVTFSISPNMYTVGAAAVPAGTYDNIPLGNGSTITGDITVNGSLQLDGVVSAGTFTVSVGCDGSSVGSGYLDGTMRKFYCNTGAFIYLVGSSGIAPVTATITSLPTNPSSLTVQAVSGHLSGFDVNKSINRYWMLTEAGNLTATLSFGYSSGDVVGNEATYRVFKKAGATPTNMCPSGPCVNTTFHTAGPVAGITDFSPWTVAEPLAPTAGEVSISGRVVTANGYGVYGATVVVSGTGTGARVYTTTGPFGYFRIDGLDAGQSYAVSVTAKMHTFTQTSRVVTLNDSVSDLVFVANP